MTPDKLTETENRLVKLWEEGSINSLIHFAGSTDLEYEKWLCRLFEHAIKPTDWICASHRAHYAFHLHRYWTLKADGATDESAYEQSAQELVDSCLDGRSMFNYTPRFIQSAIVAGLCGVAAGIALSIKVRGGSERVWAFNGDGAACQGAFWEAAMFVEQEGLPCSFLVESNSRQCGVPMDNGIRKNLARNLKCVTWHEYSPAWPHAGNDTRPPLKSQSPPTFLLDMAKR